MGITTVQECQAYLSAAGVALPAGAATLIMPLKAVAESLVKKHVGYNIEYAAAVTEYYPQDQANTRYDGDDGQAGFDLLGGYVTPRRPITGGRREMVLRQLPVRSIASVYDNPTAYYGGTVGGDWVANTLLPNNMYFLDVAGGEAWSWSGVVYRQIGGWPVSPRSVKVTYAAGLQQVDLDGDYAAFKMAVWVAVAKAVADAVARGRMAALGAMVNNFSIEDFSLGMGPVAGAVGSFFGTGVGSAALPTESMQLLQPYIAMTRYF